MASPTQFAILIVAALFLFSLPASLSATPEMFFVEGDVYCEVCRLKFINKLSERMPGAKVKLECRGEEPTNVTYTAEGETDAQGHYKIRVDGDHGTEECAVSLLKSGRPDCDEIPDEGNANKPSSIVTLTDENGVHGDVRHANPLGFSKKVPAPGCAALIKELKLDQQDD